MEEVRPRGCRRGNRGLGGVSDPGRVSHPSLDPGQPEPRGAGPCWICAAASEGQHHPRKQAIWRPQPAGGSEGGRGPGEGPRVGWPGSLQVVGGHQGCVGKGGQDLKCWRLVLALRPGAVTHPWGPQRALGSLRLASLVPTPGRLLVQLPSPLQPVPRQPCRGLKPCQAAAQGEGGPPRALTGTLPGSVPSGRGDSRKRLRWEKSG